MVKYSPTSKMRMRYKSYDSGSYLIGYDFILLFAGAILSGVMATTLYETIDPEIVDIAVYQMVSGIAGMIIGLFVLLKKPPMPNEDTTIGNLRVGFPNREDTRNMFYYFMGGFIVVELAAYVTAGVPLSAFTSNMNIAITAAVMEEALFGLALTTLFGSVMYYIFGRMAGVNSYTGRGMKLSGIILVIAQIFASLLTGLFFVALHIGVYGTTNEMLLFQLFWARFVYSFSYLRTRNIMVPALMHLSHNLLVLM